MIKHLKLLIVLIFKTSKYEGYKHRLPPMVYMCFDKKLSNTNKGTGINSENKQSAKELHKPIIKEFEKQKVHSFFMDNTWDVNLANIQLLSKSNKEIRHLLCVIDIFSKYDWLFFFKR